MCISINSRALFATEREREREVRESVSWGDPFEERGREEVKEVQEAELKKSFEIVSASQE